MPTPGTANARELHEKAIAGLLLFDAARTFPAIEGLTPADFQSAIPRAIFTAAMALRADGKPVYALTIEAAATVPGCEADPLIDGAPAPSHAAYHSSELRRLAAADRLRDHAAALARAIESGNPPHLDGLINAMEQFRDVEQATTPQAFTVKSFEETPRARVEWLWPDVLPLGNLALIGAAPGQGKTFVLCDVAARVSRGARMPDGTIAPAGDVLLLAREDDAAAVLRPRLEAAGADLARVSWSTFEDAESRPLDLVSHIDRLREHCTARKYRLIVVDTFAAFAPAGTDGNVGGDVRLILNPLAALARETGACVYVSAHTRKNGIGDGSPMDAIAGSVQMTGGVRVAHLLEPGIAPGEKWFRVVKSNLGPLNLTGWTWRLTVPDHGEVPALVWGDAGEAYGSLDGDRRAGRGTVDPASVMSALRDALDKRALTLREAARRVWATLRRDSPNVRQTDIALAIEDIAHHPPEGLIVGDGPRGGRMIGPPGTIPESPEAKALRMASPGMTARELAAAAGCRLQVATAILRDLRGGQS